MSPILPDEQLFMSWPKRYALLGSLNGQSMVVELAPDDGTVLDVAKRIG